MNDQKNILLHSAMKYGLALGVFWVIKYIFFILSPSIPMLNAVYLLLTAAVPFVAYYLTKRYRDDDLDGEISFFHAWRFGIMLYFFAALIVAVEHFIFYQYIAPPDFISNTFTQLISTMQQSEIDTSIIESFSKLDVPKPIHMAVQGIFNNIFYGIIFSIPVASLLCKKKKDSREVETANQENENA